MSQENKLDRPREKISVIAVNLNEEHTIKKVLTTIPSYIDEVIVVDGHSKDNSPTIAKELGFSVILQEGKGRGAAFKTGFKHVSGDIIVMLSTDGNERPADIDKLIQKMNEGYDLVIASRFGQGKSHDVTFIRNIGNWGLTALINIASGLSLQDSQNGFRAIRRTALDNMNISANGFDIEAEMTLKAGKLGLKVAEVPTVEDEREFGVSNLRTFRDQLINV
ncbi:MAG: glycosyltransferase family 2 protein, partial [Nanoarchaeota archaeon]